MSYLSMKTIKTVNNERVDANHYKRMKKSKWF